ncbi:glutamate 5-kinase [Arthrobacter sp. UM1]|uniref:glutamate 5-kinase n=1 Tax=Arthrobacter sp. UM1 TaxID=2766776 RepID=UPI001CF67F98|nr:glutamate 5-kinase [Arthrobacter sp. UM1]MCB4207395.1 glutamate 5-kinase [Arthrobacter sp. UM1]
MSELDAAHHPVASARRIVVKVGSSSLTSLTGGISRAALHGIVDALAEARARGTEIVFVSSGAIAAGLAPLGLAKRPRDLATQQAAATVGQGLLMHAYAARFQEHGLRVGQVLLTSEDLVRRSHHVNAFRALERLLAMGALPIVNENDAVATHEIRFGDNDRLAALVAHLIKADALVLLSDVDAVYSRHPAQGGERLPVIASAADLAGVETGAGGSGLGTGGMATKISAASIAADSGVSALVTRAGLIREALAGDDVGTLFPARGPRQPVRKMWLAHLADSHGSVHVDAGAARALVEGHKSLLAAGVTGVTGEFDTGDPVDVVGPEGTVARGIAAYESREISRMMGRRTRDILAELGEGYDRPIVHADDLAVVVENPGARS